MATQLASNQVIKNSATLSGSGSLANAIANAANGLLIIDDNVTLTANTSFAGLEVWFTGDAVITTNGFTATFDTPDSIQAARHKKIFALSAATELVFNRPGILYSPWVGVSPSESRANNTTYLQYAFKIAVAMQGICHTPGGSYPINATTLDAVTNHKGFGFTGDLAGWQGDTGAANTIGTVFDATAMTSTDIGIYIYNSGGESEGCEVGQFTVEGPSDHRSTQATTTKGVVLANMARSRFTKIYAKNCYMGIDYSNVYDSESQLCGGSYCYEGSHLGINIANFVLNHPICEVNYVGIADEAEGAAKIINPELESNDCGYYLNPKNGSTGRQRILDWPYFEDTPIGAAVTSKTILIGTDDFWTRSGTIDEVWLIGGFWDTAANVKVRNVTNLKVDISYGRIDAIDVDSTVSWTLPHIAASNAQASHSAATTVAWRLGVPYYQISNPGTGPSTLTLPDINTVPRGMVHHVKRVDTNLNNVTIDGNGAQTIEGVASIYLNGVGSSVSLFPDLSAGEWKIISGGPSGYVTYDPPSLADGAQATTTLTVTGAEVGDFVLVGFGLDLQGITVTGYVSAANTVEVVFQNESGGVLDLGSAALRVRVIK